MPTTLTYGYVKPVSGDKGSSFFPILETDIQQLNDHNHDGLNSALLSAGSAIAVKVSASQAAAASWGADLGGGRYRQLLTVPSSIAYASVWITARDHTSQAQIYPTIEKVTATTFYVYSNDNTVTWDLIYSA